MAEAENATEILEGEIRGLRGRFTRGNKVGKGRPKGAKNVIVTSIKAAMTQAVEKVGSDGRGTGGVAGYLEQVARTDPSFMAAALIRATVPPAREPELGAGAGGTLVVNIVPIPSGQYLVDEGKYRLVNEASARLLAQFNDDGTPKPIPEPPEDDPPPPQDAAPVEPVLPESKAVPEPRADIEFGRAPWRRREPWDRD